ncbi:MAG: hypothetical protein WC145_07410 [Aliarcobacter sp.]
MGDMSSGGAPRIRNIVEYLKKVSGAVTDELMQITIRRSDGTEIGTATNPIHVDICGEVPDTMDISRVGGEVVAAGSGNVDGGTLRVTVATDDVNASAIKTATEATRTAVEGTVKTSIQTSIPSGTNEIGGVNVAKVGGTAPTLGKGDAAAGTLRVAVATDDVNLSAIKTATEATRTATEAAVSRDALDQVADTGSGPIQSVYAPTGAGAFRLEHVTIHLSAVPTAPGDIVVWLNSDAGSAFDVALFRVDPSEDQGVTDICYIPDRPIPCMAGDSVSVTYDNDDTLTYGVRIVARGA